MKNWREGRPRPLSATEALRQRHDSLHSAEKMPQRRRMPFRYRTAWMDSDILFSMFAIFAFTAAASVPHAWIYNLITYSIHFGKTETFLSSVKICMHGLFSDESK